MVGVQIRGFSKPMIRLVGGLSSGRVLNAEATPRLLAEFSTETTDGRTAEKRWTRLRITEIEPGQFLCEKIRGPIPLETRSATVNNLQSAKAFFGGGWVVKELFAIVDPARFPRWP